MAFVFVSEYRARVTNYVRTIINVRPIGWVAEVIWFVGLSPNAEESISYLIVPVFNMRIEVELIGNPVKHYPVHAIQFSRSTNGFLYKTVDKLLVFEERKNLGIRQNTPARPLTIRYNLKEGYF